MSPFEFSTPKVNWECLYDNTSLWLDLYFRLEIKNTVMFTSENHYGLLPQEHNVAQGKASRVVSSPGILVSQVAVEATPISLTCLYLL